MPIEWAINIVVPIFNVKGDIRNCCCHRGVKLLEHGMKVPERVFEKRLNGIVSWYGGIVSRYDQRRHYKG